MPDFAGGSGMPGSIGLIMMNMKVFTHQVICSYVSLERSMRLRHCARTASEVYYPDIRLDINGNYRH